jgi:hypothetical protein
VGFGDVLANLTKTALSHWGGVVVSDTVLELKQGVALTNDQQMSST